MIVFSTNLWDWDITNFGLTLTEQNDLFFDKQTKSFSFPLSVEVNEDVAYKLNLVVVDGVYQYESKIFGNLQIDDDFYEAYISINEVVGQRVEITFFYGKEVLKVFDKKLSQLNFPLVNALPDLPTFAKNQLLLSWPDATHQFVKVLREDLKTKTNYEYFDRFLNNYVYDDVADEWSFPVNTNELIDGETTAVNRNVMVPMPYLMEILKIGFKEEALDLRGEWVNDSFNQKIILVPQNYLEKFSASEYLNYSFSNFTSQEQNGIQIINVYQQTHTPTSLGAYKIDVRINMNSIMAQYFDLKITQGATILYEVFSQNSAVGLNETVDINIVTGTVFQDIVVTLKLVQQNESISSFNNFTYEYKEAPLVLFPDRYNLSQFMPDMNFRSFFNKVRTWLNIKPTYTDNAVYLNYLDDEIDNIQFISKTHLEDPDKNRILDTNNLFRLTTLDEKEVLVNKDGQTFNDSDYSEDEIEDIDIDVLPLPVESNYLVTTAVYPEDEQDLMFILFDGLVEGENIALKKINNRGLEIQDVFNRNWKNWLKFRTNSEAYSDSFQMHYTESLHIDEGIYKYNKHHIMISIKKKRISREYWQVDVKSETL